MKEQTVNRRTIRCSYDFSNDKKTVYISFSFYPDKSASPYFLELPEEMNTFITFKDLYDEDSIFKAYHVIRKCAAERKPKPADIIKRKIDITNIVNEDPKQQELF